MLNNFFAPFVLKIYVDVWGLFALFAYEPFKQQIIGCRINCRYTKNVTYRRVGSRPTPLAQDGRFAFMPCEIHNILDGQEILRNIQLGDERQLFV